MDEIRKHKQRRPSVLRHVRQAATKQHYGKKIFLTFAVNSSHPWQLCLWISLFLSKYFFFFCNEIQTVLALVLSVKRRWIPIIFPGQIVLRCFQRQVQAFTFCHQAETIQSNLHSTTIIGN